MQKIGTGQGSSTISRCMKKLQSTTIEGDEFLTSWNKIELMSETWEEKFKEAFTSLFVEAKKQKYERSKDEAGSGNFGTEG